VLGLVRQHRRTGDVADGPEAGNAGAAVIVDDDGAALDFSRPASRARDFSVLQTTPTAEIKGVAGHVDLAAVLVLDVRDDAVLGPCRPW